MKHIAVFAMLACFFLSFLWFLAPAPIAHAAGVVSVCDESHLVAALSGGGTVTFACSGTITLTSAITIVSSTTLDGAGQSVTISGNRDVRVFSVNAGATFNLQNLTVANGRCNIWCGDGGGGLLNRGTVNITNVIFSYNLADISGGGAIANYGMATVTNSTIAENRTDSQGMYASGGGGLYNAGTANIINTTIDHNESDRFTGGGIYNGSGGTVNITNTTISENVSNYGGGFYNAGTLAISNSIVVYNGYEATNCRGYATTGAHNLADDEYCGPGFTYSPPSEIGLGPLGNHGGSTLTLPLLPGSPAIDAGDDAICAAAPVNNLDQRGVARTQGAHCDIGAYESRGFTLTKTGDNQTTPVYKDFTQPLTVRLTETGGNGLDDVTFEFVPPYSGPSAQVSGNPYYSNVRTDSNGYASVSATANASTGSYYVTASTNGMPIVNFALRNTISCGGAVVVTNGNDSGAGSLRQGLADMCANSTILFDGDYTVTLASQLTVAWNATIDGGGHRVTLDGNHATRVFYVNAGVTLNLQNLTVANGNAGSNSGGGLNNYGTANITNVTFSGNSTSSAGGGMDNEGTANITNSTFSGNSASFGGGGLANYGMANAANITFSGNSALSGGGLTNYGTATVSNSIIANSPSGGDCHLYNPLGGSNNLADDDSCGSGFTDSSSVLLGPLTDYGGGMMTVPLLPGSAAIDGTSADCPMTDQRGILRSAPTCDIGAFESRGFGLARTGGDGQSTLVNTPFTIPLRASVTSTYGEPVDGGQVIFTPPGSSASAIVTGSPAPIAGGAASVNVAANSTLGGPYNVTANARGADSVDFVLTNMCANSLVVTNGNDAGANSLRQAIAEICANGTITFNGDYTVAVASQLTIDKNVTIDGAGQRIAVSGNNATRVFNVNGGVTFNLHNLTVASGNAGSSDGGGLGNQGTVNIANVTFSGNRASSGGGLANYGTATVTNSTFSGNSATLYGGGLYNRIGMATVTNSSFSGNSGFGGGGLFNSGILPFVPGHLTVQNSIVANSPSGGNCGSDFSGLPNGAHNLADNGSCGSSFTNSSYILLGTQGNLGGETETIPLLPGSSAIDAGDDATCAASPTNNLDQRGIARPQGAHCDIGAYESRGFTLTKTSGDNQGAPVSTAFALPLTVNLSETGGSELPGSTITFSTPGSGASATLSSATATTDSGGNAIITTTANGTAGIYNVSASTPGATSVNFHLTNLAPSATTTTVTSAPNPSDYGQPLTFTATVTSTVDAPTGSVTFYDNGLNIGSGTLNASGQATMTTPNLIVGAHPITATYGGDATHSGSTALVLGQTVNPQTVTATIGASSKTYDGLNTATVVTRTLTGVIGTDDVTVTVTAAAFVDPRVGIGKAVTATGLALGGADAGNYQLAATTATTTANITPAMLTVTADNQSRTPDAPDPTFTFHYSGFVNGETAAVLTTAPTCGVNGPHATPGRYPITCSGGVDENYSFYYGDGTLSVGLSDTTTTLTSAPNPSVYGQHVTFTATVTSTEGTPTGSLLFYDNGMDLTSQPLRAGGQATATISGFPNVGAHPITAFYIGDETYNGSTSLVLVQTVNPQTVTATIGASSKTYDGLNTATLMTRTLTGVIGTDDVTVTVASAAFVDPRVGIGKGVTATGLALSGERAGNYQLAATTATATANITARALTVSATGIDKVYDGTTAARVALSDDRVAGDTLTGSYASTSFADPNVGNSKTVNVSGIAVTGTDAGNYIANTTTATTANITPAMLVVMADNQSRTPDAPDPTFTFHYSGFVNGETAAVLTTAPTCRVNGLHATPGTYPITCSGGVDENYSFSYVDGTLSVGLSDTTTTLTSAPNPSLTGHNVMFTVAVSSSTMPVPTGAVTVTLGGSFWFSGALTNGRYVGTTNALSAGTYALVATYGGDASCNGSTSSPYSHTVKANTTTTLTSAPNASLLGQTVTFTATIAPAPSGGMVQFYADGLVLGSPLAVSNGRASTSTATLGVGAHPITATYSGDPNYVASASNQVNQQVNNPSPTISTISPTSALVNAPDLTLMVTGTNFVPTSAVQWSNGSVTTPLTTTYVSTTKLTAAVPGSLLSAAGPISVMVFNSTPGGGRSNSGSFTINLMPSKTDSVLTLVCNLCMSDRAARLTATVTNTVGDRAPRQAHSPRDATPTGKITFQDNGANIPGCVDVSVNSAGQAVCSTVLSGGHHIFSAQYSGDGNFNSSSGTLSVDVLYYYLMPSIQRH